MRWIPNEVILQIYSNEEARALQNYNAVFRIDLIALEQSVLFKNVFLRTKSAGVHWENI